MNTAQRAKPSARGITVWVLSVLVALPFLYAGVMKLLGQPMLIAQFASLGLPLWFMYVVGAIEVGGALLLFVPRYAALGAVALACIMVGAVTVILMHFPAVMAVPPAMFLVVLLVVAWLRDLRSFLPRAA